MPNKDIDKRKAYHREYHKKWYANPENAKKQKERAKIQREKQLKRNKEYFWKYKEEHPCEICGESRPQCLDLHHNKGDKEGNVSEMVFKMYSLKRIEKEIKKCIVVCRNCHANIHYEDNNVVG